MVLKAPSIVSASGCVVEKRKIPSHRRGRRADSDHVFTGGRD